MNFHHFQDGSGVDALPERVFSSYSGQRFIKVSRMFFHVLLSYSTSTAQKRENADEIQIMLTGAERKRDTRRQKLYRVCLNKRKCEIYLTYHRILKW